VTTRIGRFDARPLALFRIALGVVLLEDFIQHARGLGLFYADGGVLSHPSASISEWSLFAVTGSSHWACALFVVGIVAALAFTLGLFTRAATAVLWVVFVSRMHRTPELHNGGDALAAILLLFMLFADCGARGSLDARRDPTRARDRVPALAPLMLQAIPAVLYVHTAWLKLGAAGGAWFDGTVLFEDLHLAGWARPGGVWLREHPGLCEALGASTIAFELAVPMLLLMSARFTRARAVAIVLHVGLQLGILVTLKVGVFTNVMLAVTALWLPSAWLDQVWPPLGLAGAAASAPPRRTSDVLALLLFVTVACAPIVQLPVVSRALALDLNATLFTRAYPSMRWEAHGELVDGTTTDPLTRLAQPPILDDGLWNSLWMQLPYRLQNYDALGRVVCDAEPALRTWRLTKLVRVPSPPDAALAAEVPTVVIDRECAPR
jgi:hypothetical protein